MPGTRGGGGGGRAGGGGAGRGGGAAPALRLNREPSTFAAISARSDDLGTRAAAVLARIDWPGKPGGAAAVTPLTAEEEQRFAAGREVYANVCVACHQEDGLGKEKIAASLVGSTLATGPAQIPVRILLHGKEGPVGLMPPLGQAFSDDQVAAVLTYIRRQWGNTAAPVDAAAVKSIRAATTTRTRPWTNEELVALLPAGGGRGGSF
jgi:mono/diheme cytochrome c family protein